MQFVNVAIEHMYQGNLINLPPLPADICRKIAFHVIQPLWSVCIKCGVPVLHVNVDGTLVHGKGGYKIIRGKMMCKECFA